MSDNLESNPFSALFTSVDEAENFTQQEVESIENLRTETGLESANNEEGIRFQARAFLKVNHIIEEVFHVTLNKNPFSNQNGMLNQLVFLEDLAAAISPQDWLDLETLEQALFERLLLEEPSNNIIMRDIKETSQVNVHAVQKEVLTYLFECFMRLSNMKSHAQGKNDNELLTKMIGLVLRNASTALKQPDLFESQLLHSQILELFKEESVSITDLSSFFGGICEEFVHDDGEEKAVKSLTYAFLTTLNSVHREIASSGLFTLNNSHIKLLHVFASNNYLGLVLLRHSTPRHHNLGRAYADTLFGSILCLSCLPKSQEGPYEFFDSPLVQATTTVEGNVWTALGVVAETMHQIIHRLLKCSAEVRDLTLTWLGDCLYANTARGKLWNLHGLHTGSHTCVSDGFMLNLSSTLLHLCQPFCGDDKKFLRVDPTYCGTEPYLEFQKGIHMQGMAAETCLIPGEARLVAQKFGFVTECFFLTHRALDLGFRVAVERLLRLNQDLGRIQRAYNDAQSQGGGRSEVVQALRERLEMQMTRYLSLRAALLEPKALSMMSQLLVATSHWLVQVTLDPEGQPRDSYAPLISRPIEFPLPQQAPATLSCVPEFVMENTACFLSFVRRFSPRTLEEQGLHLLSPILTQVLVFMGSQQRMRNPHLRARLAECLESLLPHHSEEQPALNPNPLGCFYREQLFKQHPHRSQIVQCLLDVFVGIEMTGQSVAFEQKFNYRRPMYIVMDYLWQLEDYHHYFRVLAKEAESNMEAVTPPLFLRFINLLMNDAVFLLDDALSNMAKLRQMQTAREVGVWQQLPRSEREQNEAHLQHTGMMARFDNILGRETIHTLEFLTSSITSIFSHPTMVDRIAAMLNYFLYHLVGPNKKNFKVKDQKDYEFNPANIVMDICKIYVHLSGSSSFCLAVSQDGRSYSPKLFTLAEDVLARIGGGGLIADLQAVALKVATHASQQQAEEVIMADAPDEFLDPIMSTVMCDPVILPSSRTTVDRSTIARHLLSDQTDPFNRSPLTMDLIKPNDELRNQIEAWIKEKREQRNANK